MSNLHSTLLKPVLLTLLVAALLTSCAHHQLTFVPDDKLPSLRPFKATVEAKEPCAAYLRTTTGKRLCIGGPGATREVAGFVQLLQQGHTYTFPDAFLEYQKR